MVRVYKKGKTPKSSASTINEEKELTKEDERILKMERARIASQERAKERAQRKVQNEIDELNNKLKLAKSKLGLQDSVNALSEFTDDDSTNKILNDIKHAYKSLDGRKKLKEIMEDDKQFANMIKEMLKMETALKLKQGGENDNYAVFVVIRGLQDEKNIAEIMGEKSKDIVSVEAMNIVAEERENNGIDMLRNITEDQEIDELNRIGEDDE